MSSTSKQILVPAAIIMSLALAPMLTACSNPIQDVVKQATGGKVDVGGSKLPDDFPKEVPVAPGKISSSGRVGSDDSKIWSVTVQVSDEDAMDGISSQMKDAGFKSTMSSDEDGGAKTAIFTKDSYGVLVTVDKGDEGGFTAEYTVTYTKPGS